MITASHNPKDYNGMKSLAHSGEPYNLKKYGPAMEEIMQNMTEKELLFCHSCDEGELDESSRECPLGEGRNRDSGNSSGMTEQIEPRNILSDWITQILRFTSLSTDFSKYTLVADGGNGVAGVFMSALAQKV